LAQRVIVFSWTEVQGANAYIFTLFQQTQTDEREVYSATTNQTSYTFDNLRLLDRGTFVWRIEPVNIIRDEIEQRGNIGESKFVIDVPSLGPVQIENTGIMYGN
jgi:hypothetical protein